MVSFGWAAMNGVLFNPIRATNDFFRIYIKKQFLVDCVKKMNIVILQRRIIKSSRINFYDGFWRLLNLHIPSEVSRKEPWAKFRIKVLKNIQSNRMIKLILIMVSLLTKLCLGWRWWLVLQFLCFFFYKSLENTCRIIK